MSSPSRRVGTLMLGGISMLVYGLLYLPVAILALFSFNDARSGASWEGFSTKWYAALLHNDQLKAALANSLGIAVISTFIAVVLGTMLSLAVDRHRFKGRGAYQQIMYLPIVTPEVITGVSLLAFFSLALSGLNGVLSRDPTQAFRLGSVTVAIAHIGFNTAFVALIVRASLRNLDPALEEASRDLGASPWVTFWKVTLPAIMPGVLGGALLAFTLSLDNFVITFFVTGPGGQTLPLLIFASLRRTISPEINAISTLIVAASTIVLLTSLAIQAIGLRRRAGRMSVAAARDEAASLGETA